MQTHPHILVIRLSAMGDVAMTVPVLKAFLAQNPNAKVTVLSKAFLAPVFNNIDRVTFYSADVKGQHKGVNGLYQLYKELKLLGITHVADLHNVLRSKILRSFFKSNANPVKSIDKGRKEKKALCTLKNKVFKKLKSTHQRYANVFIKLGFTCELDKPYYKATESLSDNIKTLIHFDDGRKKIGIAPFAAHQGKKYPLEFMKKVIQKLSQEHTILLFGGGKEEIEKLKSIALAFSNTINIAGAVNLEEELNIISHLDTMVSMDSGNGHFAAMFGIPTITIWGATHPYAGFAPYHQYDNCITADRSQYPLLPTSIYGKKVIPGYEKVMESIQPEVIIEKTYQFLKSKS